MFYFYVLRSSKDDKLYKGYSKNVEARLKCHNIGKISATKQRRPFELIYTEVFETQNGAMQREKFYKSFKGGKELRSIIEKL